QLQNSSGKFVQPTKDSFAAAVSGADWAKATGYHLVLTNAPGKASWPIAGSTFILMQKVQTDAGRGREALKFFSWVLKNGGSSAQELYYVPLPKKLIAMIENTWKNEIK